MKHKDRTETNGKNKNHKHKEYRLNAVQEEFLI